MSDIVAKIRAEKNSNIDTLILEASNVEISNNMGLIIPVGTTLERGTSSRKGTIRYNSTDTAFEGYDGANWGTLGGVKDVSQTTLIRAETSPGANNKQLDFIIDGEQRMQIDSNGDFKFGDISNQDIKFSIDYLTGGTQTIIPKTDMTYDLGSSNNSWDKLYLQKAITPASDSGIYLNGQRIMYIDTNGNLKIGTSSSTVNIPGNFDVTGTTGLGGGTAQNNAIIAGGNIFGTIIGQDIANGAQSRERALFSTIDVLNNSLFQNHITIYKDIKIKFANQAGSDTTNLIDAIFNSIDVSSNSIFRSDLTICGELIVNNAVINGSTTLSNNLNVDGIVNFNNTSTSNATNNGALVVDGGVGIAENLNVGGTFTSNIESVKHSNSSLTPQNVFQPFVPPGAVMSFATKGAPQGWLECNGQLLLRSSYQNLFDVIGTTWDTGVGNNEFRLPNLNTSGYFIKGGVIDGNYNSHKTAKPSNFSITTEANGAHAHNLELEKGAAGTAPDGAGERPLWAKRGAAGGNYPPIGRTTTHANHSHTVNVTGWDDETEPKNIVLLYCIKY
jgi:microcystin-dependent protein